MEFRYCPNCDKKWATKELWDGEPFSQVSLPSDSGYFSFPAIQNDVLPVVTPPMSLNQQIRGIKHGKESQ